MLQSSLSAILGVLFVFVGAVTVWLIFHASSRLKDRGAASSLVRGHRIGGYIFIIIFCVMTYFMIIRIKDAPDDQSLRPLLHMLLAMLMIPLLFVKVLVARYYKTYYSVLMPLGLIVFTLAFVLVMMTVGPYFIRRATIKDISLEAVNMGNKQIDIEEAQNLTQKRCAKCHDLDRVVGVKKDAPAWLSTINRMRALPGSGISESDGIKILSYLVAQNPTDATNNGNAFVASSGKSLVDTRCNKCHDLDRTYGATKSADEWRKTVVRMVVYAKNNDGLFKPGDDEEIIKFLSQTQTPEAVTQKKAEAETAAAKGESPIKKVDAPPPVTANSSTPGYLIISFSIIFFGFLMFRRPGKTPLGAALSAAPANDGNEIVVNNIPSSAVKNVVKSASVASDSKKKMILQLARIEPQTADAKTLRFLIPDGETFRARPGQFLTFNFMVDGKKVARSYSICSSPTQQGYIEITPKRVLKGVVSTFLNDRATVGLTVEAKGPSGRFFFDEAKDNRIILIAAGSGITPMMSILRYIDDRCLNTDVTLLYSVRTKNDIIFGAELERLKTRLPNFKYAVTLSKNDADWKGACGRIDRKLVENNVKDIKNATYFLCGPKDFMECVHGILINLAVNQSQIKQESFGGLPLAVVEDNSEPSLKPAETTQAVVEFARSRKTCHIPPDKTLLEVAEINGVAIPFSCRQGQCGTCTTRILEGDVTMAAEDGLDPELKEEGYILTCVGYAKGNVKLDV